MTANRPSKRAQIRDLVRERRWLEDAEHNSSPSGFAAHAQERLADGQRLYGDRWAEESLAALLTELQEEAADLGAWGVLALQALSHAERTQHLDDPSRAKLYVVRSSLSAVVVLGAHAHYALVVAQGHLDSLEPSGSREP
jgi:hypothetical protein